MGRHSIRPRESTPTRARLLMIVWNASKALLLTGQNAAGQRPTIAHDRSDPYTRRPPVGSADQ